MKWTVSYHSININDTEKNQYVNIAALVVQCFDDGEELNKMCILENVTNFIWHVAKGQLTYSYAFFFLTKFPKNSSCDRDY